MPTPEERLSAIEAELRAMGGQLEQVRELIDSGPHVPWEQSIRGKLHTMKNTLDAGDKLAAAAREVRRSQRRQWSAAERVMVLLIGLAAAAAPYVVLLLH